MRIEDLELHDFITLKLYRKDGSHHQIGLSYLKVCLITSKWGKSCYLFQNNYILGKLLKLTIISQYMVSLVSSSFKYFHNLSPRRIVDELVDEPLAVDLGEDAPLVIISQGSAHRLVVHIRLVLVEAPQPGHRLAVHNLKHASLPVHPFDVLGAGGG